MPHISREARQKILHFAFVVSVSLLVASVASAAPMWGDQINLVQPDGTEVPVNIWGDEFYRVVESSDGYTLVRDPESAEMCFAEVSSDGAKLVSTGVRFDTAKGEDLGLQKHLRIDPAVSEKIAATIRAESDAYGRSVMAELGEKGVSWVPVTTGEVEGITLIIDFSDQPALISAAEVDNYLNQPGYNGFGNNGSVRDYYYDISDGQLTFTNYVSATFYRAEHPKSYYDDCSLPQWDAARPLIREALDYLDSQGFDFSQYDSNGDGTIDALSCYIANLYTGACPYGYGLASHANNVGWSADGVSTARYQLTSLYGSPTLGTFCHESAHMLLQWPDLYDHDFSSNGVGYFCVMSRISSNTNPGEACAPMKHYAGWGNVTPLVGLMPNLTAPTTGNSFFKYTNPLKSHEYFLIENRQRVGRDWLLPTRGLAIWHVDEIDGSNDYEDQTADHHYEVTLVQADGRWDMENDINYGDSTDLFSAPIYTEFGMDTSPHSRWWGGTISSMGIENISYAQSEMTFTFNPTGETHVPAQFATIQGAINAAVDGDVIVLADGVYTGPGNVDLDLRGKEITLKAANSASFAATIDCGGSAADPHRAFNFSSGETAATVVEGLTVINGYAAGDGGAVLCDGTSPTLRGLYFSGNETAGSGGALHVANGALPTIENCIFSDNTAANGGAVSASGSAVLLEWCTFYGNDAVNGAALAALASSSVTARNSIVANSLTAGPAYCESAADEVVLECSNVVGNLGGDWTGCLSGQQNNIGNFSLDPLFCDPPAGDLGLLGGSPCAAGFHPDGATACEGTQIGALGVGCLADVFTAMTTGPVADPGNGRGAAWGDYDGDGDPDLFLVNYEEPNVLLRNDGNGVFSDVTIAPLNEGGPGTGCAWADYDNDGDLDLYVVNYGTANRLYRNGGAGGFADVTTSPLDDPSQGMGVNWVDYDNDGKVDLYLVNDLTANMLVKNFGDLGNGSWLFYGATAPVLSDAGSGSGACWGDFDGDGDQDVYLVNQGANLLIENGGVNGYVDVTGSLGDVGLGSGAAWGDITNDGRLDLFVTNVGQPDVLWSNEGAYFAEISGSPLGDTGPSKGVAWGDFDNDGLQDLLLAQDGGPVQLYWNQGNEAFVVRSVPGGAQNSQCVTWADYDNDGDLDAYVTNAGNNVLLRNDFVHNNHWLHVDLEGVFSNRSAIGARLRVVTGQLSQVREITAGCGYLGMNSLTVEFGLGDAALADSLIVDWPSGTVDVFTNLLGNRRIKLVEGGEVSAADRDDMPGRFLLSANVPNPFNPVTTINYELPQSSAVTLTVYDIAGRVVRRLRSGETEPKGRHRAIWDGNDGQGRSVASGTYFYRLEAAGFAASRRMALIR